MLRRDRRAVGVHVFATCDAVGGVWTYALALATGLRAYGVTTTLAIMGPVAPVQLDLLRNQPSGLEVLVTNLPLDWLAPDAGAVRGAGAALARMAQGADIIHLNAAAFAAGADFAAPVVSVCHSCIATWWQAVRGGSLPADLVWRRDVLASGYAASTALIAPSAAFAAATAQAYAMAAPKVVHNGQTPTATPHDGQADFVFTAGRLWDPGKGAGILEEVASRIPYPLKAAGALQGEDGTEIQLRHILSPGRLTHHQVAGHLAARPVFVSAASYEPFGLAVLEAAQAGCALVLSDIPSFRELWGEAALYAPPADAPAFAAQITRLMHDPALRAQYGRAAQVRAARYTVDAMVQGTLAVYRQALAA